MRSLITVCSVFVSLVSLVMLGCGEAREVTLYLQDLKVNGPVVPPAVHITENPSENEVHLIPRFSFTSSHMVEGRISGHTMVNRSGFFQIDTVIRSDSGIVYQDRGATNTYPFQGENLKRTYPSYGIGIDGDFGFSKTVALSVGAHFSSVGGQALWAYRAGIGLRQQKGSNLGWRIDFGWQWEELQYHAVTVVADRPLTSAVSTVTFYTDEQKKAFGRFYGSLVLNTVHTDWPLNIFFQASFTGQKLDGIQPSVLQQQAWVVPPYFVVPAQTTLINDRRGSFSSTYIHLVPGVYFNLAENVRALTGVRLSFETEIESQSKSVILAPFFQFDLRL